MSEGDGAASRRRSFGPTLARVAVTLLLLGGLLAWLPTGELVGALRRVGAGTWAATLAIFAAGHVVAALKWRALLHAAGLRPGALEVFRAHGAGLFANLCLPSLVGGDVVRAGIVARGSEGLAPVAVAGLADRLLDTAAVLCLAAIGAALVPGELPTVGIRILQISAVGLLGVAVIGPVVLVRLDPATLSRVAARLLGDALGSRAGAAVEKLRTAAAALSLRPRTAFVVFGLALGIQGGFVLANAHLGAAVGIAIPLSAWFLAWPLAKLAGLVPVSLGGIGVREAALAALLLPFGVEPALAVAQSLLWETVLVALGLSAGAAFLLSGGRIRTDARAAT